MSKNIYDHIYFSNFRMQKIPAYKIRSNCTGKQAFYSQEKKKKVFVKNLMGAISFLPGAESDLYLSLIHI